MAERPAATRRGGPSPRLSMPELWAVLAVLLPVLGSLIASISTVDLAYHVRAGELILDTAGCRPPTRSRSRPVAMPWLDQQWAAQAAFGAIFRLGGWALLATVRAALVGLIAWLVFRACRSAGAGTRVAAWLTLAGFAVGLVALGLRPQLLGMALFAATLAILAGRERRPALVWAIPLIVARLGQRSRFVLPRPRGRRRRLARGRSRTDGPALGGCSSWPAASAVATILNPYGAGVWTLWAGSRREPDDPTPDQRVAGHLAAVVCRGDVLRLDRRADRGRRGRRPRPVHAPARPRRSFAGPGRRCSGSSPSAAIGGFAERGVAWWSIGAPVALAGLLRIARELSAPSVGDRELRGQTAARWAGRSRIGAWSRPRSSRSSSWRSSPCSRSGAAGRALRSAWTTVGRPPWAHRCGPRRGTAGRPDLDRSALGILARVRRPGGAGRRRLADRAHPDRCLGRTTWRCRAGLRTGPRSSSDAGSTIVVASATEQRALIPLLRASPRLAPDRRGRGWRRVRPGRPLTARFDRVCARPRVSPPLILPVSWRCAGAVRAAVADDAVRRGDHRLGGHLHPPRPAALPRLLAALRAPGRLPVGRVDRRSSASTSSCSGGAGLLSRGRRPPVIGYELAGDRVPVVPRVALAVRCRADPRLPPSASTWRRGRWRWCWRSGPSSPARAAERSGAARRPAPSSGSPALARLDLGAYALVADRHRDARACDRCSARPGRLRSRSQSCSLLSVPVTSLIEQLIWYPIVGPRAYRGIPAPAADGVGRTGDRLLQWLLYWLPLVLIDPGRRPPDPDADPSRAPISRLLVFAILCRLQTLGRADDVHAVEAAVPAILLAAYVFSGSPSRFGRLPRSAAGAAVFIALAALPLTLARPASAIPYDGALHGGGRLRPGEHRFGRADLRRGGPQPVCTAQSVDRLLPGRSARRHPRHDVQPGRSPTTEPTQRRMVDDLRRERGSTARPRRPIRSTATRRRT